MKKSVDPSQPAVTVEHLSKAFRLPTEQSQSIKQTFINWTRGVKGYKKQTVLKDISFTVNKGDFFGIVGRNGSGKSTLLKLISGIYTPDGGQISINGSLVSFIELGVGFNPELTGRENVYLNGALMGFSTKQVDEMYDEIVDFAELEEFMDQKLKNYSSGMQVRLAFSCAIRAKSDILVLDEILAVGDEAFQRKCNDYFEKVKKDQNQTVILVTHSMEAIKKFCSKAMMIEKGKIISMGDPDDVADDYSLENLNNKNNQTKEDQASGKVSRDVADLRVELISPDKISQNDQVKISVSYKMCADKKTNVLISLTDLNKNVPIAGGRSRTEFHKKDETVSELAIFDISNLNDSTIKIICEVWDSDGNILDYLPDNLSPKFLIRRSDYKKNAAKWAVLFDRGKWQ
jgi:ABC-2 type transport system ATP-binding protein